MRTVNANGLPVGILAQIVAANTGPSRYDANTRSPRYDANTRSPTYDSRNDLTKRMVILGSLQIIFGSFCIIFEVVCLVLTEIFYLSSFAIAGYGFWIGTFFIITGAFGLAAGQRKNRGFVITFNVLSIISACFTVLLLILAISSAVSINSSRYYRYDPDTSSYDSAITAGKASIAMESLMAIIAIAEAIVAIYSSVVCSKSGACCCDNGDFFCCLPALVQPQVILVQQPSNGSQQQQFVIYNASALQQPGANVYQENMIYPSSSYQKPMVDPNIHSETGIAFTDRDQLCV